MDVLCLQLQPDLSRMFCEEAIEALRSVPVDPGLVEQVTIEEGNDAGRYVNLLFVTVSARKLWPALREEIMRLGLQRAVIVTCTGREKWRDYLLLHHFDPDERVEDFDGRPA